MPFVDLPARGLHQYYTINPSYPSSDISLQNPPPESRDALDDSKPTLVFVHAGSLSSDTFVYQFRDPRLSNALNLVSFDTRYYGRTTGPKLDHFQELEERADELLDAIDAVVGKRPFSMLGESFVGAHCCTHIASRRPEQVKAIIMISPSYFQDPEEIYQALLEDWIPVCATNKDGNGDGTGRLPEEALAPISNYFFSGSAREPGRQKSLLELYQYQHGPGHDLHKSYQLLHWFKREPPSKAVFERVVCRVLILEGTKDETVSPLDASQQWFDALVNVKPEDKRVQRIVDGTHLLATTDAGIVNRFVLAFLKRYNLA
ncbi:hypothetical protein JCM5296_000413 [Sporobolomyces johnsonii]